MFEVYGNRTWFIAYIPSRNASLLFILRGPAQAMFDVLLTEGVVGGVTFPTDHTYNSDLQCVWAHAEGGAEPARTAATIQFMRFKGGTIKYRNQGPVRFPPGGVCAVADPEFEFLCVVLSFFSIVGTHCHVQWQFLQGLVRCSSLLPRYCATSYAYT